MFQGYKKLFFFRKHSPFFLFFIIPSFLCAAAELPENQVPQLPPPGPPPLSIAPLATTKATVTTSSSSTSSGNKGSAFAGIFNSSNISDQLPQSPQQPPTSYSGLLRPAIDPMSLSLSSSLYGGPSIFPTASQSPQPHYLSRPQPVLSATALLQKAAQMGATSSNSSFLRGLGLALPSSSSPQSTMASASTSTTTHWSSGVKLESNSLAFGLGLGLPSSGPSSFNELMMSQSTLFGSKPATLDFLGLGMEAREASSGGFSAFLSSIGSGINIGDAPFGGLGSGGDVWDDQIDRKPSMR